MRTISFTGTTSESLVATDPGRRPLLTERRHALGSFVRTEQFCAPRTSLGKTLFDGKLGNAPDQFLGFAYRVGAAKFDHADLFLDRSAQPAGRNRSVRQTQFDGLVAGEAFSSQKQLHGVMRAQLGNAHNRDYGGYHTDPHLAEAEWRVFHRHDDVGGTHEPQPTSERRTIDRRNHRLGTIQHQVQHVGKRRGTAAAGSAAWRTLQVGTRAKSRSGASEYNAAYLRVLDRGRQMAVDLVDQDSRQS